MGVSVRARPEPRSVLGFTSHSELRGEAAARDPVLAVRNAPRVAIVGASGAGKTTLARAMSERLRRPIVHLDTLWYGPGWTIRPREEWLARLDGALGGREWIAEGNYAPHDLAKRADLLIVLEHPAPLRLASIVMRGLRTHTEARPDSAPAAERPQSEPRPQAAASGFCAMRYASYIKELLYAGAKLRDEVANVGGSAAARIAHISRREAHRLVEALERRH